MLIKDLLYILQKENYEIKKFLKFCYSHWHWWNLQKRDQLEWTLKMQLLLAVTLVLTAASLFGSWFWWPKYFFWLILPLIIFLPVIIILSLLAIQPLDSFLKNQRIKAAKKVFQKLHEKLTVVGITGSYGKTSTKEILATILQEKFQVAKIDGNINTDLGIAEYILKNQPKLEKSDIFIVEMGAFQKGDIEKLCQLVKPDYSILTGISDCHLERFGNQKKIIQTKFELPENTNRKAFLNEEDENIKKYYQRFQLDNAKLVNLTGVKNIQALEGFSGIEFRVGVEALQTKLLAFHNIALILLAIEVAKELGMNWNEIRTGVEKLKPVPHRLELMVNPMTNITIIDDSYNGNYNGIASGVEVLSRAPGRKIVLTPGLVELGTDSQSIHRQIGRLYAQAKIDQVLLIKNRVCSDIISGLEESGFKNYRVYESTEAAHQDLANVLQKGDTIIFQNDWADNYF